MSPVSLTPAALASKDAPTYKPVVARPRDAFSLWDLRVEVARARGPMVCNHRLGDFFELSGENLSLPLYPLAALLPLLPAKQRQTHPNDWMSTDSEVACPDPRCGAIFRIVRLRKRSFRHADVSAVPLPRRRRVRR
jgi:uncharacterized repeat protein (TIGR04076 family)